MVMGTGFGFGFGMFQIMFTLMFLLIAGVIIMNLVKGIGEWNKNNHSPRLTVPAKERSINVRVTYHCNFYLASGESHRPCI